MFNVSEFLSKTIELLNIENVSLIMNGILGMNIRTARPELLKREAFRHPVVLNDPTAAQSSVTQVPYKFYVLGQIGLSKQCRPRSDCF